LHFGLKKSLLLIQNAKSKIANRSHCGATVRAFHPAFPFVSLLEKARPRAFETEKELFVNRKFFSENS
jgi:hypothetical protein